jgi:transcriptional regulator with XRE-family HTH domain
MDISKRLRQLREEKGWSHGEVARRSGLLRPYICRVERGHTVPTLPVLERWTKALGVTLREFFAENVVARKTVTILRLTYYEKRLFGLLRRMDDVDRRLILSIGLAMAKQRSKNGRSE